jgi:hydroxyacylglutathione hydrolase
VVAIRRTRRRRSNTDPDLQTYWYDDDTVILRQNMAIDYEAPFLFLLFGEERAVLLDTGATASPDFFRSAALWTGLRSRAASTGCTYQPDEPSLEMTVAHLHATRAALDAVEPEPARRAFDDFILWPEDD